MIPFFETKKVKKTESNPYAKYAIDKELVLQLGLLQEKDIKKFVENKSFEMASLPSMYMNLNSKIMYCAIMKDVMREAFSREENQDNTLYKKRDLEIKTECPIYNEIYEKFVEGIKNFTEQYILDDPLKEQTNLGPVVKLSSATFIRNHIKEAISKGAKDIIDNKNFKISEDNNCYVSPSILIDVDHFEDIYYFYCCARFIFST